MPMLEIKIGESWKRDPEYLRLLRGDERRADLYAIHDTIEIKAGELALTQRLSEDSIVYILHDLATGLLALLVGERRKLLVQFYEHPYELAVTLRGEDALLSFYSVSGAKEVIVRDRAVPLASLCAQVTTQIERLYAEFLKINPALSEDLFLQELIEGARTLRRTLSSTKRRSVANKHKEKRAFSRAWGASGDEGFTLSFWLDECDGPLRGYQREITSDLHSLLFSGQIKMCGVGLEYVSHKDYPFLLLESLVGAANRLLSAIERGEMSPHFVCEWGQEKLFAVVTPEGLELSLPKGRATIALSAFVEEIVCNVREMLSLLYKIAPNQRENERLGILTEEVDELEGLFYELSASAVENQNPTPYRVAAKRAQKPSAPNEEPLLGLRRMGFTQKFSMEAGQLSLLGVAPKVLVVSGEDRLIGFERERGRRLWEISQPGRAFFVPGPSAIVASQGARWMRLDPMSGQTLWESRVGGRDATLEGAPIYIERSGRGRLVGLTTDRRFVCLDATTGRMCFHVNAPRRGTVYFASLGKLLYAATDDGALFAIDVDSGELIFRQKTRRRFLGAPLLVEDLVICASSSAEAHLVAFDAYRGDLRWERGVGVALNAPPLYAEGSLFVASRAERELQLSRILAKDGAVLWACDLISGTNRATTPVIAEDRVFVIDDAGVLRSVSLDKGSDPQHIDLGTSITSASYLPPAPKVQRGLLFVAADTLYAVQPQSGQVIGRVIECPAPPEQFYLGHDFEAILATDNDFIASYRLSAQLGLV